MFCGHLMSILLLIHSRAGSLMSASTSYPGTLVGTFVWPNPALELYLSVTENLPSHLHDLSFVRCNSSKLNQCAFSGTTQNRAGRLC